jgi:hypothetical protein
MSEKVEYKIRYTGDNPSMIASRMKGEGKTIDEIAYFLYARSVQNLSKEQAYRIAKNAK